MGDLIFKTQNSTHRHHVTITRDGGKYSVAYLAVNGSVAVDVFDGYGDAYLCAVHAITRYTAGMSRTDKVYKELIHDLENLMSA